MIPVYLEIVSTVQTNNKRFCTVFYILFAGLWHSEKKREKTVGVLLKCLILNLIKSHQTHFLWHPRFVRFSLELIVIPYAYCLFFFKKNSYRNCFTSRFRLFRTLITTNIQFFPCNLHVCGFHSISYKINKSYSKR